jgi:hypothetical protein
MRRSSVLVFVMILFAACGGSTAPSSTAEGKRYVDAIMTSYRTSGAQHAFTTGDARCMADAAIDAVGTDALRAAKLGPTVLQTGSPFQVLGRKLPKSSVERIAAALVAARCVPVGTVLLRAGAGDDQAFSQVSRSKVRCIFQRLGAPEAAQRAFADSLLGLSRADAEFTASFRTKAVVLRALSACKVDPKQLK